MSKNATPRTIYLKEYQPPAYLIDTADLVFHLQPRNTRVRARLVLRRNPEAAAADSDSLRLHGEQLKALSLMIDGSELESGRYHIDGESLTILNPPDQFVLETEVEIDPESNTALEGLYRSSGMFCTQCEAEGFRRITWFLDRPDVMTRFTTRIEADAQEYPILLSNGNPQQAGELPDGRHFAIWVDPFPKPSYLFALVAGNLEFIEDQYITASGREVQLKIYVESENIDRCEHAMQSLKNAMRWDEEQYGREYDLDVYNIVAVNDFNMGAMENKGLNIFNSKYVLARSDTATDRDFQGIEGVIAHEYFHNWTGNRVTCRDWFQLSLKEGFTVFRDQEFSSDMGSRGVKRIEDVRMLRAHQFAEDASPMAHPVRPDSYIEINNFYTVTVYEKGAEVVRMQANLLGTETFRKATDLYFERFDGAAVTTDDFMQCMADASGRDMSQFRHWYDYAGTPELSVSGSYNAEAASYTLTFKQHTPDTPGQSGKPAFHIPVLLGLLDSQGLELPLHLEGTDKPIADGSYLLELRDAEQQITFTNLPDKPVPSLLRGLSAPVKLDFAYSDEELMFLMAYDTDGFNRWDAAQRLSQKVILGLIGKNEDPSPTAVPDGFVDAFRATLLSGSEDKALIAEVLSLPAETYLGDQMDTVDVDGVFAARETVKTRIAESLQEDLLMIYEQNREQGDYDLFPASIGRRSLKNLVLGYLMSGASDEAKLLCLNQYGEGHNMTDVMMALALIADSEMPEREEVLADFAQRWQHDTLVMDKWFSVQAMARHADVLTQITGLMSHPAFSIRNPNKVRALIGAFVSGNPVRFHAADGSGYEFLADRVLEINALNPQIAARMLRVMARWQRYDKGRQDKMRAQLERIVSVKNVSNDVYEIASKSLKG